MKKLEIVVIGAGKFGTAFIEEVKRINSKNKIIVIDSDEDKLQAIDGIADKIFIGNSTNEKFMKEIGIDDADVFVVGIGTNMENSMLTASLIKQSFKGRIIAKAVNERHEDILEKIGITEIVNPEAMAAKGTALRILNPLYKFKNDGDFNTIEFEDEISFIKVKPKHEWQNTYVKDLKLPKNISIILLYRDNEVVVVNGDSKILENDLLWIIGKNKELEEIL